MKYIIILMVVVGSLFGETPTIHVTKVSAFKMLKQTSIVDTVISTSMTTQMTALKVYPMQLNAKCLIATCSYGITTSATSINARYVTSGTTVIVGVETNAKFDSRKFISLTNWNGDWHFMMMYGKWGD